MTARVSIIIPCHNVAQEVGDTLRSLRAQTLTDWQAVLVDDGSTDDTLAVLASLTADEPRCRIVSQANQRLAAARNNGMAFCVADRVLLLDAGDELEPDALAILSGLLDDHPNAGAAFGGYRVVGPRGEDRQWIHSPGRDRLTFNDFAVLNPVSTDSLLIRRIWFQRSGPFDVTLPACEDWDMWARMARMGCVFVGTPQPVSRYRMTPGSHSRRVSLMLEAGSTVLERLHAVDERCPTAHPDFEAGAPIEALPAALSGWCGYCLALAFAQGGAEAADRIRRQAGTRLSSLDPQTLARHIYVAMPLAACRFPDEWDAIWAESGQRLRAWLGQLEQRFACPQLAERCERCLHELLHSEEILDRIAGDLLARAASLRRVIVYGHGVNGRGLLRRIGDALASKLAVADDVSPASSIDRYLPPAEGNLIVVTPWANRTMCERLEARGAVRGRHYVAFSDYAREVGTCCPRGLNLPAPPARVNEPGA